MEGNGSPLSLPSCLLYRHINNRLALEMEGAGQQTMERNVKFDARTTWTLAILLLICGLTLFLSGCSIHQPTKSAGLKLPWSGNEEAPTGVQLDQQGAWAAVNMTRFDAIARKAEADAQRAEAEAETAAINARDTPPPKIIIDSDAELKTYAQMQQMEAMARMMEQNAKTTEILARALNPPLRDTSLDVTPQPIGAAAQVIESAGVAIKEIVQTPAGLATSVGIAIGTAVKHSGTTVEGDMVASQIGSNSAGRDQLDASTQYGYTDRDIETHEQTGTMDSTNDSRPTTDNSVDTQ